MRSHRVPLGHARAGSSRAWIYARTCSARSSIAGSCPTLERVHLLTSKSHPDHPITSNTQPRLVSRSVSIGTFAGLEGWGKKKQRCNSALHFSQEYMKIHAKTLMNSAVMSSPRIPCWLYPQIVGAAGGQPTLFVASEYTVVVQSNSVQDKRPGYG